MTPGSMLPVLNTMLETAVIVRAQYLRSRAYGDREGMTEAIETSLAVDQDLIAILADIPFEAIELSGKKYKLPQGSPEEIIEEMRVIARLQSASLSALMITVPGQPPEIEERNREIADRKMNTIGAYFRRT